MVSQFSFNRETLFRLFFFGAFAFLLYQWCLLAKPFLTALLCAGMLGIAFFPLHVQIRKRVRQPDVAAVLSTLCVFLVVVVPALVIGWFVLREAAKLLPAVQHLMEGLLQMEPNALLERLPLFIQSRIQTVLNFLGSLQIDPQPVILEKVSEIGTHITAWGAAAARNTLFALVNGILLVLMLFFCFRDGETFLHWLVSLVPMEADHKKAVTKRAYETFIAVGRGVFLTASAQGVVAMLGFWVAGVKIPALLGLATALVSLLGASFLVTLPVAFSMLTRDTAWGVFLLIWGLFVVGLLDNFLKPLLIGSRARMPFVLIFFSILGGVKMYGLLGIIIGPILAASLLTFIRIYRETYKA